MHRVTPYGAALTPTGPPSSEYSPPSTAAAPAVSYRAPPGSPDDPTMEAYVSRTLYFCKLPPDTTEEIMQNLCQPYGAIRKVTCYPSRFICFVEFWDIRESQKARNALKGAKLGDRAIEVQFSRTRDDRAKDGNTGTLYVRPLTTERNFHDHNSLEAYKELFAQYGEVKKVNTNRKREAEKFVEYHDLRAAERACQALNGFDFNGVALEVQFANHSSKTINKDSRIGQEIASLGAAAAGHQFGGYGRGAYDTSSYGPMRMHGFGRGAGPPAAVGDPLAVAAAASPASMGYLPTPQSAQVSQQPATYWSQPSSTVAPVSFHWGGSAGPAAAAAAAQQQVSYQQPSPLSAQPDVAATAAAAAALAAAAAGMGIPLFGTSPPQQQQQSLQAQQPTQISQVPGLPAFDALQFLKSLQALAPHLQPQQPQTQQSSDAYAMPQQ